MAQKFTLPELVLADWHESRDTLHRYARLAGKLRAAFMPRQKHWGHISLHAAASGLTTTPMPVKGKTLELLLDCMQHRFLLTSSEGESAAIPLEGQSVAAVRDALIDVLAGMGVGPAFDDTRYPGQGAAPHDTRAIERYWRAHAWIDGVFKRFRGELREETGPVQVFPHHFDLSMHWFSGRRVPGADPDDEESADEQMNFGFLSGDEVIPDAYFYITAYPTPEGFSETPLPGGAYWHTEGFTGAILRYDTLRSSNAPEMHLLEYLRTVQRTGAARMQ